MRKAPLTTSILFLVALSADVFAVGNIGPATAELKAKQWSLGGDYAYSDVDLDTSQWKHTNSAGDPELMISWEFEDVKTNFYYVTLGYGLTDNWEVYGRLGVADIKGRVSFAEYDLEWGMNFDNDVVWGVGTRLTFYERNRIRWGVTAQMNWIDTSADREETSIDYGHVTRALDLSAYDLLVAVGPTVDMGGWQLYGGPFFYMFDGDTDYMETWTADGGGWEKGSSEVNEDGNVGAYIGAAIPVVANTQVTLEAALTGGGWAAGAGASLKF